MTFPSHAGIFRPGEDRREPEPLGASSRACRARACASLFVPEPGRLAKSIVVLTEQIGLTTEQVGSIGSGRVALRALGWSAAQGDTAGLLAEYRRLYGDSGSTPKLPLPFVPVCACSYMGAGVTGPLGDVTGLYERYGFNAVRQPARCPAHISTELEFLAHCLEMGAVGDPDGLTVASAFTIEHLFPWAAVFAAASVSRARHPVTRFAAEALEHLLFEELSYARALR